MLVAVLIVAAMIRRAWAGVPALGRAVGHATSSSPW
jgi:hypothetical protein